MLCAVQGTNLAFMELNREQLRDWLRKVLLHLGWSGSDLAGRIDAAPSTINRFLNDPSATHVLSARTLKRIESATGFQPLRYPDAARAGSGFAEPEAMPFDLMKGSGDALTDATIAAMLARDQHVHPWVLRNKALESAGYFPGDILMVGLNERAQPHDVVCAQVYDWNRGGAETIFRLYEPPFLLSASTAPQFLRPLMVDDDRVTIKGVVLHLLRPRRSLVA